MKLENHEMCKQLVARINTKDDKISLVENAGYVRFANDKSYNHFDVLVSNTSDELSALAHKFMIDALVILNKEKQELITKLESL